ncbi:MAG TPA: hypothetical protein VNJ04_11815 [Gemmatimonadaceae bacterium]|nr:hypothetical protein [Gemmatimonadaceae bacterium]
MAELPSLGCRGRRYTTSTDMTANGTVRVLEFLIAALPEAGVVERLADPSVVVAMPTANDRIRK